MLGQTISHYRILEKLGEGGMGIVYKAEDTMLGRTVALKFLPERALQIEELNRRFTREAQAAARLDHPNICTVYGLEEAEGRRFLVMAYLEGETLHGLLSLGPLPLRRAVDIAVQVAQGLQEAHDHGIVHRDIKPGNIFVTRKGLVKITDFSLAFLADRSRITKAGSTLGTVAYMSPEQFLSDTVDRRADIWSLGVVLYEMLCGCRPFQAGNIESAMQTILKAQPPPPAKVCKGCPPELDRVVCKALSKDRNERYQYVDDMIVDLKAVRETLPPEEWEAAIDQPHPSPASRAEAPTETISLAPAQPPVHLDLPAPRRASSLGLLAFAVLVVAGVLIAWWQFLRN